MSVVKTAYIVPKMPIKSFNTFPSGFFAESRPCEKCYNLLNFVGIKKVYYSDKFGNIISCALQDMEIKSFRIRETRRGVKFPIDNV